MSIKMSEYRIESSDIREYLETDRDFSGIEEFCSFLLDSESQINIKHELKKMLLEKVVHENKEEQHRVKNRLFKDSVEWIRQHCSLDGLDTEAVETSDNATIPDRSAFRPERDFQKVKSVYEQTEYKKVTQLEEDDLDYTEDIVLHEGGIITQQNQKQIFVNKAGIDVDPSKILIVEAAGNRVLALGYLVQDLEDLNAYTVVFQDKNCIDYDGFSEIAQARFVIYTKKGDLFSYKFDMRYEPFSVERKRPLCIDFGTSNTTAGSYGILNAKEDKAELVRFIDVTVTPNNTNAMLLPTMVYVEDCFDPENIKYLFGYEARKRIEEEHYESTASVFYEIKRWIVSADEPEEIRDGNNNRARPLRKEIIKAYIDYVIENAEQYFATRFEILHFSAPVKLKEKSIYIFTELYKGKKKVLSAEDSIDEGISIVYNQLITLLFANNRDEEQQNTKKSIMIMDCGGGTTDLVSCEYTYQKRDAGIELKLDTCFENGNANFGGNNITYRIMQLLKIKIAAMFRSGSIDHDGDAIRLINKSENEILGSVERYMKDRLYDSDKENSDIYADFLRNYDRAEEIIPTRYQDKERYHGAQKLKKIKRNFYYLWRQAEQIKIEFYRTERVLMDFKGTDTVISILNPDNYYLYVTDEAKPNELCKESRPFEKVRITIKEINRVICGDIYSLLVGLFQNGELTSQKRRVDDFDYYKLSGQSCRISLFSELIKEYIPGRKFRPAIEKRNNTGERNSEDLKLDCIRGSINYVRDQARPEINIVSRAGLPEMIYDIFLKRDFDKDERLFSCKEPHDIKMEVSHKNTQAYPFVIKSLDGICEREFFFELRDPVDGDLDWTTEELKGKIQRTSIVSEEGIDRFIGALSEVARKNQDTINIVFVVPAKQGYGVRIGQIQSSSTEDGTKYQLLKYDYENFEDASKTFFDGRR